MALYPQERDIEIYDLDLSLIFVKLSMDNIIFILLAILSEAKLLFISKNCGLLTPIIHVNNGRFVSIAFFFFP
jgi:hypothetical protein